MNPTSFRGRRLAFALLAALIFLCPGLARSGEEEDIKKEIADVEKQIAELKKKLENSARDRSRSRRRTRCPIASSRR